MTSTKLGPYESHLPRRWKILLTCLAIMVAVGIAAQTYWIDGIWGAFWEMTIGQTTFAPGYREYKFRHVALGISSTQVKSLLGEPLSRKWTTIPGEEVWFYTQPAVKDKDGIGSDCCYTERYIYFTNGIVTFKRNDFYFD
jgi:hypothetical protein